MSAFDDLTLAATECRALYDAQSVVITDLLAEVDRLQAIIDGDPNPAPVATLLGACPINGGSISSTVTKWGRNPTRPIAVRYFDSGEFTAFTRPSPADVPCLIVSIKPADALSNSELIAIGNTLTEPGDLLCVWHETDVKHKSGSITSSQRDAYKALQSDTTTKVRALRSAGTIKYGTIDIFGGWRFRGAADNDRPDPYIPSVPADVLGVDLDGTSNTTGSYYNWAAPAILAEITRVKDAFYGGKWICPEYAWGALSSDGSRTARTAAINAQVPALVALDPLAFIAFDFNNFPGEAFESANEIAALKSSVA